MPTRSAAVSAAADHLLVADAPRFSGASAAASRFRRADPATRSRPARSPTSRSRSATRRRPGASRRPRRRSGSSRRRSRERLRPIYIHVGRPDDRDRAADEDRRVPVALDDRRTLCNALASFSRIATKKKRSITARIFSSSAASGSAPLGAEAQPAATNEHEMASPIAARRSRRAFIARLSG